MTETSMVSWHADSSESFSMELYSEKTGYPAEVESTCYSTTFEEEDDHVIFTTKRPLDCGTNSYIIDLDQEQNLSASWKDVVYLSYHGNNKVSFSCQIDKENGLDCDRKEAEVSPWVIHGFVMWSSWTLVGLL